jgi:hypothetical protein
VAHESRHEQVAARRPPVRQRKGRPTQSASVRCRREAERKLHSRARIESSSGCARASFQGCRSRQATLRLREACLPVATGRVDGSLSAPEVRKDRRSAKRAARIGNAVAKPRARGSPEPGARKGVAGRRFLVRRKVSRIDHRLVSFMRASRCRSWRLSSRVHSRERLYTGGRRDRDARGSVTTRRDGRKLPLRRSAKHVGPTKASRSDVNQAIPRNARRESATTTTGTNEARVLVRRGEKAEVGPTHCAPMVLEMPQGKSASGASRGVSAMTC